MQIAPVSGTSPANTARKKPNTLKITGYGAVAAGVSSALAGHFHKIRTHKYLAGVAGLLTAAHIFIIEKHHFTKK